MCLRNLAAYAETRTVVLQCGIVPLLLPLLLVTHVDVTMCAARALCKLCVDRDFFDSCNVKEAVCVLLQSLQLHPDRCGMQLLFASLTSHALVSPDMIVRAAFVLGNALELQEEGRMAAGDADGTDVLCRFDEACAVASIA